MQVIVWGQLGGVCVCVCVCVFVCVCVWVCAACFVYFVLAHALLLLTFLSLLSADLDMGLAS